MSVEKINLLFEFSHYPSLIFFRYDTIWKDKKMTHKVLRETVAKSLPNLMFSKSHGWDNQAAPTPEAWVKMYSKDKQYVDHYFVELMAEYLQRKLVIYPVFEEQVR